MIQPVAHFAEKILFTFYPIIPPFLYARCVIGTGHIQYWPRVDIPQHTMVHARLLRQGSGGDRESPGLQSVQSRIHINKDSGAAFIWSARGGKRLARTRQQEFLQVPRAVDEK